MYDGDIASVLITEDAIREKIAELAVEVGKDYAELCAAPDDDFELRFDEEDEGVSGAFAVGGYVEYQLTPRVSIGAGIDGAYLTSVGAVVNPSSGDEVFFDGLTTRLGVAPARRAASASDAKSTCAVRSCSPG